MDIKKEQEKAAILSAKLTDEEIDTLYENPGVAKYLRAFSEGKIILVEFDTGALHKAQYSTFFDTILASEHKWSILQEVAS